jgi:hypothetical protein
VKVILFLWMCTNSVVPGKTNETGCMPPARDSKVYESAEACISEATQRQSALSFGSISQPATPKGKMLAAMDFRCLEWDGTSKIEQPENTFQSDWAKSGVRLLKF